MQSLYKRLERETLDDPIVVGIPMASSLVSASLAGIAGTSGVWLGLSSLSGSSPQASLGFLQAWQLPSSWIPCMATFFPSRGSSKGTKWKLQSQTGTDIFGSQKWFRLQGRDMLLSPIYDGPKKAFVSIAMR